MRDPVTPYVARLDPLVVLADGVFGLSARPTSGPTLVSALGVHHPLRLLMPPRVWQEHTARATRAEFVRTVGERAARARASSVDLVAHFVEVIVPGARGRDWGDAWSPAPDAGRAANPAPPAPDVDLIARRIAAPAPPCPGMWAANRVWRLAPQAEPSGVHVRVGSELLALTGEFVTTAAVIDDWRGAVEQLAESAARALIEAAGQSRRGTVAAAMAELDATGVVQRGPLLLLSGNPLRVGHLMPPHFNVSLDRDVRGDVALATALIVPAPAAGMGALEVFARTRHGTWERAPLPRGICLGAGVPARPPGLDRNLAAVAYLRWAAIRIAANGRFHEHDE
jgi:hypothetical protein